MTIHEFIAATARKIPNAIQYQVGMDYPIGRDGDVFLDDFREEFDVPDEEMVLVATAVYYLNGMGMVNVREMEDIMWGYK